jgi:tetratricopeptide (TPR) repeat protein
MYRRDISSVLTWLGLGVVLMVGLHLLFKQRAEDIPRPTETGPVESDGPPVSPLPAPSVPPIEATPSRVLELPPIPASPYKSSLAAILDHIDSHQLSLAETDLRALPADALSDTTIKNYAAILWNNLGIEQERIEGTEKSVHAFKRAAALDGSNPVILLNLAYAYWELRDPALNGDLLNTLIGLAPEEPFPHLAMAEWLQEHEKFDEAARHLGQGADRAKQDPALRSYLASVTAKLHRRETADSRPTKQGTDR